MSTARLTTSPLSATLRSRLGCYSAGALTGALSIASSEAAVVYVNANRVMVDTVSTDTFFTSYNVDLNGDTISDLMFWTKDSTGTATTVDNDALITGPSGAGLSVNVVGLPANGFLYPARLNAGQVIDASAAFINVRTTAANTFGWLADGNTTNGVGYTNSGFIAPPNNTGYLGVQFKINGNNHYGWMRITVKQQGAAGTNPRSVTLHEFAYESTPDAGIAAGFSIPEPTSLGLLALGSLGLAAHRRRRLPA